MTVPDFADPSHVQDETPAAESPFCLCGCGFTSVAARKLDSSAIPHTDALALGITPLNDLPDLPPSFTSVLPLIRSRGMLITGTEDTGDVTRCVKPDVPVAGENNRPAKYVREGGNGAPLWRLRSTPAGGPVLLVEGEFQSRSVARWAPDGVGIVGVGGCNSWHGRDLSFADGHEVVVLLDKDRETNSHVRQAARDLEDALWDAGAAGVRFASLPDDPGAAANDGPDDYLGRLFPADRPAFVSGLLEGAELLPRPELDAFSSRLCGTDELDSIPAPKPLIPGWLTRNSLARLVGEPGTGKSFVALEWAGAVGTGGMYDGKKAVQGEVLYIVAEGAEGIRKRVRAWEQHNKRKMTGVSFYPAPVQVMGAGDGSRDDDWKALLSLCRRRRPAMVVLDTQSRVTVGVEENSNTEMGRVVDRLEGLRRQSGACVLLVHHTSKGGDTGRGAGVVTGALTSEFRLTREGGEEGKVLKLENTKEKDEADGRCRYLKMQVEEIAEVAGNDPFAATASSVVLVDAEPEDSLKRIVEETERKIPEREQIFRERLDKHFGLGNGGTKAEMRKMVVKGDPKEGLGPVMSDSTFYQLWNSLTEDGLLLQVGTTQKFKVAPPGVSATEFAALHSTEADEEIG